MYRYGILRVDESAEADAHNNVWLGESTLGIEVTRLDLAERCGLGNLDPQHGGGGRESSAIEEALELSPLPPDGARLVTIRPDKDSFGAMAVLALRAEDRPIDVELVIWIGLMDRMGLDNARARYPELAIDRRYDTDAIQAIVMGATQKWQGVEDKVCEVARILTGEISKEEMYAIAEFKDRNPESFTVEMYGATAFILATRKYNKARDWANKRYPVAVVCDPEYSDPSTMETYMRWTVIKMRQTTVFDRRTFEQKINAAEEKARAAEKKARALSSIDDPISQGNTWGGPENIVSSPQGRASVLSKDVILAIVQECVVLPATE